MKHAFVLALALVPLCMGGAFLAPKPEVSTDAPYTNCDPSLNEFVLSKVDVTPFPPVRNSNLKADIIGKGNFSGDVVSETIKDLDIIVYYNSMKFYEEHQTVDKEVKQGETVDLPVSVFLPSIAPPGPYKIQFYTETTSGTKLSCTEVSFTLS